MAKIIGLTGKKGSGKETVGRFLAEFMPGKVVKVLRFSDPLAEICDIMYLPKTRHNLQLMGMVMIRNFGDDTLTNAVFQRIKNTEADIIVLDGVRWPADYEMLRNLPDSELIFIDADMQTRFERIRKRKEKAGEEGVSFEQFEAEDRAENEIHIDEIGAKADIKIDNNGSLEDFRSQVKAIAEKL